MQTMHTIKTLYCSTSKSALGSDSFSVILCGSRSSHLSGGNGGRGGRVYENMKIVSLFLPHDDRVSFQVFHVDRATFGGDVRMFAHHQPAHVREEEAAGRVVRVCIRVGELVMDPVVAHPFVYVVLERERLEHSQQYAHRQPGVVATMGPQPVRADRYAKSAAHRYREH